VNIWNIFFRQEESSKMEEAVGNYAKCLSIRPDHPEAKEAVWSIYNRYERIDFAKLNPLAKGRVLDLKEKVKSLLQNDLKKSPVTKTLNAPDVVDTKKRKESSSESSSSDSSDSDDKKSKKKKKKRKSKKSKKKKSKPREKEEPIQQPLSPFSKRLAEGGGDMAGLVPFKDAEWTKIETPVETEVKKKKKEKRKHRSSDSSSSSSTSSDSDKRKKKSKKKKKKK